MVTLEEALKWLIRKQEQTVKANVEADYPPEAQFMTEMNTDFLQRLKDISAPLDVGVDALLAHYKKIVDEIDPNDHLLTHHLFNENPKLYFTIDLNRDYLRKLEYIKENSTA